MKRLAVNIADQQDVRLRVLARALGVTQSEILRQFLEEGLVRREQEMQEWRRRVHPEERPQ